MDRPRRYLSDTREARFPNLRKDAYEVTSNEDGLYNCIAHAADKKDSWWWPLEEDTEGVFWPEGVDKVETMEAFAAAFCTEGYRQCEPFEDGSGFIEGFEKVAIFADADGTPSHAAKQTADRKWTSKLGDWEDIEHNALEDLGSHADGRPGYGKTAKYLIREIRQTDPRPQEPAQSGKSVNQPTKDDQPSPAGADPLQSSSVRKSDAAP